MTAPPDARAAPRASCCAEPIVHELRLRWVLRLLDGPFRRDPRALDRLGELLTAHDENPTSDTLASLLRAAEHLGVTGVQRHSMETVARSVRYLAGRTVVFECPRCGHWTLNTLTGDAICGPCAERMQQRNERSEAV